MRFFQLAGGDLVGDQIVAELVAEGVLVEHVVRVKDAVSPFSFIHVDDSSGERTIFHRSGAGLTWDDAVLDFGSVLECGALIVDDVYPDLALAAARVARAGGVLVVADMTSGDKNAELLRNVDVLIAPSHFARQIGCEGDLEAALDAIHGFGPTTAIITLGSEGWVYSDPSGSGRGGAFEVDVVDTTGAGDTFHGAFAYGVARGWDTPRSAEFASAVAAIKCTQVGGRTGLPTLEQALEFLGSRSALNW